MSNYPDGCENDPNAPWNQSDPEPRSVGVCVSTTLSKCTVIQTSNYTEESGYDCERDEDGHIVKNGYHHIECHNLIEDYKEKEYTIPELLRILELYVREDLKNPESKPTSLGFTKAALKNILESCQDWGEDELEVV